MQLRFAVLAGSLGVPSLLSMPGHTQAQPTAVTPVATTSGVNFSLPTGTFRYGGSVSEVIQKGYFANQAYSYQTNFSGSLAYSGRSVTSPFSAVYSGGVQIANQSNYGTTFFQSLALSQGYLTRNWTFGVSDVVSYLPQSPTVGLSGIPGAGDLGLDPVTSPGVPSQDILTYNSNRISNTVTGTVSRRLSGRTSISGDSSYSILHFFNDASFDSRQIVSDLNIDHALDARTDVGAGVSYSIYNYDAVANSTFETRGVNVHGSRRISPSLSIVGSVGPQWINASSNLGIPSRITVAASASATYTRQFGTFAASYTRGTNGGSGVVPGAFSDSLGGSFSRSFGVNWSAALTGGYSRTTGLGNGILTNLAATGIANDSQYDSVFGGAQANRRLTRSLSAFASYTAFEQTYGNVSVPSAAVPGALNGLVQSFAFGISFYPHSLFPGQF